MGILSFLGLGKTNAPLESVAAALDKLFTSDEERAQAALVLEKLRQQPHLLQAEVNKLEAAHASVFVAGWRPALGWVCAASLGTYYIPMHVVAACLWVRQAWQNLSLPPYPIGPDSLLELVFALLGLGILRSAEKIRGLRK